MADASAAVFIVIVRDVSILYCVVGSLPALWRMRRCIQSGLLFFSLVDDTTVTPTRRGERTETSLKQNRGRDGCLLSIDRRQKVIECYDVVVQKQRPKQVVNRVHTAGFKSRQPDKCLVPSLRCDKKHLSSGSHFRDVPVDRGDDALKSSARPPPSPYPPPPYPASRLPSRPLANATCYALNAMGVVRVSYYATGSAKKHSLPLPPVPAAPFSG